MEPLEQVLTRALDLALEGKISDAQATLADRTETPALQLAAFLKQRANAMSAARHDMGNALSIARSSVEAMLDGIVETTQPRMNRLREILTYVSEAMYALTADAGRHDDGNG